MKTGQASRTAEFMALFRALESTHAPGRRLFNDPFAPLFLRRFPRTLLRCCRWPVLRSIVPGLIDARAPGARTSGIARTRLIDDALATALADGVRQVVILGAGFDARAYRLAGIEQATVFEVDLPDTQAAKRQCLRRALAAEPAHVRYVPTDFNQQRLEETMAAAGFDPARRTFFLWEGVTNYLSAAAVDVTFRWFAAAASDSRVVFTYVHRKVLDDPKAFRGGERLLRRLQETGEPWTFGFDPAEVAGYLAERGLELLEDVGAADYRARYWNDRARAMPGYEFYRLAVARVRGPGR